MHVVQGTINDLQNICRQAEIKRGGRGGASRQRISVQEKRAAKLQRVLQALNGDDTTLRSGLLFLTGFFFLSFCSWICVGSGKCRSCFFLLYLVKKTHVQLGVKREETPSLTSC